MLIAAVKDENPVIFLEHRWLYSVKDAVPEAGYETPLDKAVVRRAGTDVTLIGISYMTLECLKAAELLAEQGVNAEVIDLRSVRPIDYDTLVTSVFRTRLVLIADHATLIGSVSSEIAATLGQRLFDVLRRAPIRVALPDCPATTSHRLSANYYPISTNIAIEVLSALGKPQIQHKPAETGARHDQPDTSFIGPF